MTEELIKVTQLPVIEERLRSMKADVDADVEEALSLVCTEETIQSVKAKRTELNKVFQGLEEQRKAVKAAVLGPYEAFEAVYKECVSDTYKAADKALKSKIDAVESDIKARCENGLREYFSELCAAYHLEWLEYEKVGITVDLASAKQKTPKKLRESLTAFVKSISSDVEAISTMDNAPEIMTEYKATLNLANAVSAVQERHRRIEAEQKAREERQAALEREAEAIAKVEAAAPPEVLEPPTAVEGAEKTYRCTFTVMATKSQLRELKNYLKQEGIQYE